MRNVAVAMVLFMLMLCLLVNEVVAAPTLIVNVSVATNPDGSVFSGVPFRVDVSVVPGAKYTISVKPIGNLTYAYTYKGGELTIVGEPGYYYVVVNASLGSLRDYCAVRVRLVQFKPEFSVRVVNEDDPFVEGLRFAVEFTGSENWTLPVTFEPILESYVDLGRYRATVYPSSAVLSAAQRNVTVSLSFWFARNELPPGFVRVGVRVRCFYWSGDYVVSVPTYYLLERPGTVKFNLPVKLTVRVKGKEYHDSGQTITFPVVYGDSLRVTITGLNDKVLFDKTVDGKTYSEFLRWVRASRHPILYLKADNSSSVEGCYLYVVGEREFRIATLSPIGIPNSTAYLTPVPGSKLYCVGAYSVITVRGDGGVGFNVMWVAVPFGVLMLVGAVAVLVKRRKKVMIEEAGSALSLEGASEVSGEGEVAGGGDDLFSSVLREFAESEEGGSNESESGGG